MVLLPGDTWKIRAPFRILTLVRSCLLRPNIKFMENKQMAAHPIRNEISNVMTNPELIGSDRVSEGSLIHPGTLRR